MLRKALRALFCFKQAEIMNKFTKVATFAVIVGLLIIVIIIAGTLHMKASAQVQGGPPTHVTEVPSTLPSNGVNVNNQVVLLPLPRQATTMTPEQAIQAARQYANSGLPAVALAASLTVPGSIPPPGYVGQTHIIQNVAVWIVTFTSSSPQVVSAGMKVSHGKGTILMASHFNIAIDAKSGAFVLGFFTA